MARERFKVLIVDDDPFIAEMYLLRLEADGYEVVVARDGEEGLTRASTEAPDVICLDYRLPGIDGLEVVKQLQAEESTKSIPVIMLSNDGDPAVRERGLHLGALMFVVKAEMAPAQLAKAICHVIAPRDVA